MTTITSSSSPEVSTRTPYVPFVVLFGALVVLGVVLRLLNAGPAPESAAPLSGAAVAPDQPIVVTQTRPASGELSLLLPAGEGAGDLTVGPAAFPAESSIALTMVLPRSESTAVDVALTRLGEDGSLTQATSVSLPVTPDEEGRVAVHVAVQDLIGELGAGIYRVDLVWDGNRIGGTDVALGLSQPSSVAIFEEPRQVTFEGGEYTGVKVNASGRVVEEQTTALGAASGAPAAAYARFFGTPHVLIARGAWAGYWMPLGEGVALQ